MKKILPWIIVIAVAFNAIVLKNPLAIGICCVSGVLLVVAMIGYLTETPEQRAVREQKAQEQKERREAQAASAASTAEQAAEEPAARAAMPIVRARSTEDILEDVDHMDGIEFESWCAHLLERLGYENVETTVATGDQGVDVIAERKGMKYAIQCKRYNSLLGNGPIQEVYAGMRFYDCRVAVVMTNSRFTRAAYDLAEATGVKLWDRYMLKKFLRRLGQS